MTKIYKRYTRQQKIYMKIYNLVLVHKQVKGTLNRILKESKSSDTSPEELGVTGKKKKRNIR